MIQSNRKTINDIKEFSNTQWDTRPYLIFLRSLSDGTHQLDNFAANIFNGKDQTHLSNAKATFEKQLKNILTSSGAPSIHKASRDFDQILSLLHQHIGHSPGIAEFQERGDELFEKIELANRTNNPKHYYDSILTASHLLSRTISMLRTISYISSLFDTYDIGEHNLLLQIKMDSDIDYNSVIQKSDMIELLYNKVCNWLGIDHKEHPFKILSIESGSVEILGFGIKEAVQATISLLTYAGESMRQRLTIDGRTSRAISQAEAIKKLSQIEKELREDGYDTSNLRNCIQERADSIADSLDLILKDNTKLEINGKTYTTNQSQVPLLESRHPYTRQLPRGATHLHQNDDLPNNDSE